MADERVEQHDDRVWSMWHNAYLIYHKWKKFPDMKVFLSKREKPGGDAEKRVKGINEDAIMAWLVASKEKNDSKKAKK